MSGRHKLRRAPRHFNRALGAALLRLRTETKLSARALGVVVGCTPSTVYGVESGELPLSVEAFVDVVQACGTDPVDTLQRILSYARPLSVPGVAPAEEGESSATYAAIACVIRQRRTNLGLTQSRVAHLAGLHQSVIASVESGSRKSTLVLLEKVCRALDTQVVWVIRHALALEGRGVDG